MIASDIVSAARLARDQRPEFGQIWETLRRQKKPRSELAVDSLVSQRSLRAIGTKPARRRAVVEWMKSLQAIGAGEFVIGRKKKPSRLRWRMKVKDLIKAVFNEGAAVASESAAQSSAGPDETSNRVACHEIRLRSDFVVRLPENLSKGEATRLTSIISALPAELEKEIE